MTTMSAQPLSTMMTVGSNFGGGWAGSGSDVGARALGKSSGLRLTSWDQMLAASAAGGGAGVADMGSAIGGASAPGTVPPAWGTASRVDGTSGAASCPGCTPANGRGGAFDRTGRILPVTLGSRAGASACRRPPASVRKGSARRSTWSLRMRMVESMVEARGSPSSRSRATVGSSSRTTSPVPPSSSIETS